MTAHTARLFEIALTSPMLDEPLKICVGLSSVAALWDTARLRKLLWQNKQWFSADSAALSEYYRRLIDTAASITATDIGEWPVKG